MSQLLVKIVAPVAEKRSQIQSLYFFLNAQKCSIKQLLNAFKIYSGTEKLIYVSSMKIKQTQEV